MSLITIITVEKRHNHRLDMPIYVAHAGTGLWEMQALGLNKWEAVAFLADMLVKSPSLVLANSVDVIDVASGNGDHAKAS